MKLPSRAALGAAFRDLGPLRPVAVYVAVAQALGGVTALLTLSAWSPNHVLPTVWLPVAVAIALVAVASALLSPAACAFVAGYACGAVSGAVAAALGAALGAALARLGLWPRVGAGLFAFMRERPRAVAVRRCCRPPRAVQGVALLRLAAPFPFAVQNLLLAVAAVPGRVVAAGTLVGVLPVAFVAAWCGALLRDYRRDHALPPLWQVALGAATITVLTVHAARRCWRRTAAAAGA